MLAPTPLPQPRGSVTSVVSNLSQNVVSLSVESNANKDDKI